MYLQLGSDCLIKNTCTCTNIHVNCIHVFDQEYMYSHVHVNCTLAVYRHVIHQMKGFWGFQELFCSGLL